MASVLPCLPLKRVAPRLAGEVGGADPNVMHIKASPRSPTATAVWPQHLILHVDSLERRVDKSITPAYKRTTTSTEDVRNDKVVRAELVGARPYA